MCGLFGLAGNFKYKEKKELLMNLASFSTMRGEDATGYALWRNNKVAIKKKAVSAVDYGPGRVRASMVMGHTRDATCGDPKDNEQAHPFLSHCKNFVLAHNGIAYEDYESIKEEYNLDCMTPVDSEGILRFLELDNCSIDQIKLMYSKWINSSFAISFMDVKKGKLFLFHNNRMPLHIINLKSGTVYASTAEILELSLSESLIQYDPKDIVELQPFVLYTIKDNKISSIDLDIPQDIQETHLSFGKG